MAVQANLAGVVRVTVVSRETGGSGREEYENEAYYRHSVGVGALTTDYQALANAMAVKYVAHLTPDMILDRIVVSTAEADSDQAVPSVWSFPFGQIGENSLAGDGQPSTLPLNIVAELKFGVDGGRSGKQSLRGVLRSFDVVYSRGSISATTNARSNFTNFATDLVSLASWIRVTVRKVGGQWMVSDCLTGAFSKVGFRQLDRNTRAKISTRESSLRKRAQREIRERLLVAASYNVLQALGELENAAEDATLINTPLPQLTGGGG